MAYLCRQILQKIMNRERKSNDSRRAGRTAGRMGQADTRSPKREVRTATIRKTGPKATKETGAEKGNGTDKIRLNKFLSNAGICSRRDADGYIEAGLVSVNGTVVTELGTKIEPGDDVRFNGERIRGEKKVYIVMNKPKNYVTTMSDPHAEHCVIELINRSLCPERVFPVGRLDKATTGVLLLTNDGELAEKLTHPSYMKKKIYHVWLDKNIRSQDLDRLVKGIKLEDGTVYADEAAIVDNDKEQIGIEIHSGKNRVIRRMMEALGYRVRKLDRVYFAGLTKKKLSRGQWRFLTDEEVIMLKTGMYE